MPQGAPDFSNIQPNSSFPIVTDLSELAVRLNSTNVLDRQGKQYWIETFSDGLARWQKNILFGNIDAFYDPTKSLFNDGSVLIDYTTDATGELQLRTQLPFPGGKIFGYEVIFWSENSAAQIDHQIIFFDGTDNAKIRVRKRFLNDTTEIIGLSDTITISNDNIDFQTTNPKWHWFKATVNLETGLYSRFVQNSISTDVSELDCSVISGLPANPEIQIILTFDFNISANQNNFHIDQIIITMDDE